MLDNELLGNTYSRLTVIDFSYSNKRGRYYNCQCACGISKAILGVKLLNGNTKSCGCLRVEKSKLGMNARHGKIGTPEYKAWTGLKNRCLNPKSPDYPTYGGRGIGVSENWKYSFVVFLSDMGLRPGPEYSIDRIDTNGNYCKENCRWLLNSLQASNTRRNRNFTLDGKTHTLQQWCTEKDLPYSRISMRIRRGEPFETAISTPLQELGTYTKGRTLYEYNGKSQLLKHWCDELGLPYQCILHRIIRLKWPFEKAISLPPDPKQARNPYGVKGKPK